MSLYWENLKYYVTVHCLQVEGKECLAEAEAKIEAKKYSRALSKQLSEATNELSQDSLWRKLYLQSNRSLKVVIIVALIVNSRHNRNSAYYREVARAVGADGHNKSYKLGLEEELLAWPDGQLDRLINACLGLILPRVIHEWSISQGTGRKRKREEDGQEDKNQNGAVRSITPAKEQNGAVRSITLAKEQNGTVQPITVAELRLFAEVVSSRTAVQSMGPEENAPRRVQIGSQLSTTIYAADLPAIQGGEMLQQHFWDALLCHLKPDDKLQFVKHQNSVLFCIWIPETMITLDLLPNAAGALWKKILSKRENV